MFSLFARRLPRTTLSAIRLCTRNITSETGPTNSVFVELGQTKDNKITHPALKEALAAKFGPVERLWITMPTGRNCIVSFQEQTAAEALMAEGTLHIPPAGLTARNFAAPRKEVKPRAPKLKLTQDTPKSTSLVLENVPVEVGVSAPELAKVFSQFGKVSVRHPTFGGYPRPYAFLVFETQEAADKALEAIVSEQGIIMEDARISATYSSSGEREPGKYPILTASA